MRTRLVIASQRVRPEVAGPMTSSAKQSSQRLITWIASSLSLLAMTHQSKLHAVRAFEPEQLPRFVRRRDLVTEVLDDATDLGDLLGIAFGELAGTNVKRILQAHSHIAADHRRGGAEIHLMAAASQDRPQIIVAEQPVGGALHEE